MARAGQDSTARRVVRRAEGSVADSRVLRSDLLAEVARAVPFDAYVWVMTDPETRVGVDPLADVPDAVRLPDLVRAKYLTPVNRWTALGRSGVAGLARATRGDLVRSLVWREVMAAHGVVDVASVRFADRYGCWGFLDLWRCSPGPGFTPGDLAFLAGVVRPVTMALRRARAATLAPEPARPSPAATSERSRTGDGPVVLLLDDDLAVRASTPATDAALRSLLPTADDAPPVPAVAYNVAAQLLAREAGVDDRPATARTPLGTGRWVTASAARLDAGAALAVTLAPTSASERLGLVVRAYGLSPREAELLGHLAEGLDSRGLAARLVVSEHTVQEHVRSMLAKTGTATRRELVSLALGR